MIGSRRNPSSVQADVAVIAEFRTVATALISDNLARLPGAVGLRPFHMGDATMAGTALTVRTSNGDNRAIHEALDLVRPGDVIVVDGGDVSRALVGEIMTTIGRTRGAAGFVIDGAIRDAAALARSDFPCFARAAIHKGPYKNGLGEINVSVSVGGLVIEPGNIVVGDADGIVAFPQSIAAELLLAVRAQEAREAETLESIRAGRYVGQYAKQPR